MGNLPPSPPPGGSSGDEARRAATAPADAADLSVQILPSSVATPPPGALLPEPTDPVTAFRLRQAERGEDITKPVATPPAEADLSDAEVGRLVNLALHPKEGDAFALGGRTFTRQFLKLDNARKLRAMVMGAIEEITNKGGEVDAFAVIRFLEARIPDAIFLILHDQDQEITQQWVYDLRAREDVVQDVVVAQIQLQGLGDALGKLSTVGALLGGLAR